MKKSANIFWTLFFPVQIIAVHFLSDYPYFLEHYYSKGLYPILSVIERFLFGWIPFSVGDLLYALAMILMIRWVFIRFKTKFRKPRKWIVSTIGTLSLIYFLFHLLWGMNYYRLPMHKSLKIDADYTTEELIDFSRHLVEKSNALQEKLTGNDSLKVEFEGTKKDWRNRAVKGYASIGKEFPELRYRQESVKASIFSIPLSYMGFNGYLNPFSNESQVNNCIPKFKLPSVTSHEMAHQVGFAKENEANFMACLTTMNHPDVYYRYAGFTFALQYCLGELYREDKCAAESLALQLNRGVKKNYQEVADFHKNYRNPLEPFFKLFYGGYLRANNQPEGMRSYDYVVALLVNYNQKEER